MSLSSGFQEVACSPDQLEADIVAAFFFEDDRPLQGVAALLDWRLNGEISALLQKKDLTGSDGEQVVLRSNGKIKAEWVLLLGGGRYADLTAERWESLTSRLWNVLQKLGFQLAVLGLTPFAAKMEDEAAVIARHSWEKLGARKPDCLVSFDRSWLHR